MLAWIALSFPLWVFRSPSHTGGTSVAWKRAMYSAVSIGMVGMLVARALYPKADIPTSPLIWFPVCGILMVVSFQYLNSSHAAMVLKRYSELERPTKAVIGLISILLYIVLF